MISSDMKELLVNTYEVVLTEGPSLEPIEAADVQIVEGESGPNFLQLLDDDQDVVLLVPAHLVVWVRRVSGPVAVPAAEA